MTLAEAETRIQDLEQIVFKRWDVHIPPGAERVIGSCIAASARYFDVSEAQILSMDRPGCLVWPRHVAMYLAMEKAGISRSQTAKAFQRKYHYTVAHACKHVDNQIETDRLALRQVNAVRRMVKALLSQ